MAAIEADVLSAAQPAIEETVGAHAPEVRGRAFPAAANVYQVAKTRQTRGSPAGLRLCLALAIPLVYPAFCMGTGRPF